MFEILERLIQLDSNNHPLYLPFVLSKVAMNADTREPVLFEKLIQCCSPSGIIHEDNYLVENKCIKQFTQFCIFLVLFDLNEVLLETVQSKLAFLGDGNFKYFFHEFAAESPHFFCERG